MKGDFSRDTFDVAKHFSRVLQQQGRVQLDADWNEQTAILLHYLRTLAADLMGPFAGPAGEALGFQIKNPAEEKNKKGWDFEIGKGRYYVDGILCENDGSQDVTYMAQKDYPSPFVLSNPAANKKYLVYLDVWERHVTALEDPEIREKALGGADTATRAQVVWQVKLWDMSTGNTPQNTTANGIRNHWGEWVSLWQPAHPGCIRARVKPAKDPNDPCLTAPDAKYRRTENQLYRVEIHKSGKAGEATFKWSRDNGAIVTACELNGTELTVLNPYGFAVGQWVELLADEQELKSKPGTLVKITKVECDVLSLDPEALKDSPPKIPPNKVRRWDHHETKEIPLKNGAIGISEQPFPNKDSENAVWINLEDGIQIQFLAPSDSSLSNHYRTGDYWLIPARVATGNIEWPEEVGADKKTVPAPKPPNGIRHHFAPLAVLTANGANWLEDDLRCKFHPLNNNCGLSYSYGDEGIGGHLLCNPPVSGGS